ncbi:MAG: 2-amino-4-hydroxy-6-hydroxymethyldihydropteridine diphosphokinase [Caldimicrobium sp.]|nr:2-amino-4-hydroxy-6-hydroxymethyldihydropteridine diphosphokinase [Caldimicrobium sp.]MCX7613770.1 2-amino-4-hydroxy-6-hydroxymethyldihydropteridine diphosphokinase [Caldimicrobium sp.]
MGTNLGDRLANINRALDLIKKIPAHIEKVSPIFENEPLGFESPNLFYNLVLKIRTFFSPEALFIELKKIEFSMGRKRESTIGDRIIDLDIIFYEDLVMETSLLMIPHSKATERAFVVLPLLYIEEDLIDPLSGKSLRQLAQERARFFEKQGFKEKIVRP